MKYIEEILAGVQHLTPVHMLFIVCILALGIVGIIAFTALTGGRRDDAA